MAASNASANGSASTPMWRAIFGLIVFSCGAAFITDRVAFSYPLPMLDGPLTLVIPAHNEAANMVKVIGGAGGALSPPAPGGGIVPGGDGSPGDTGGGARRPLGAAGRHLRAICDEGQRGRRATLAP